MASETRPGVIVLQQIAATPTVTATPLLVPCVAGVCKQIVDVLDSQGALNGDALYPDSQYNQGDLFVAQADFPDPRSNIAELNIDEAEVKGYLNFGGSLSEIPRGSNGTYGTSFLNDANGLTSYPVIMSTAVDSFAFDATVGDRLIFAIDVRNPVDTSKDVTVTLTGTLTTAQVVAAINTAAGATVARSYLVTAADAAKPGATVSAGETCVQLVSTTAGAGASITLREGASALTVLFGASFTDSSEYRVTGGGLRGQDDNDSDLITPWLEPYGGALYIDDVDTAFPAAGILNGIWAAQSPVDVDGTDYDTFSEAKTFTTIDFTSAAASNLFPLSAATATVPGDQLFASGSVVGEIIRVEPTRFKLGALNTALTTFDADGLATNRVYDTIEVNTLTHPTPFAPEWAWFEAGGLQFPGDGTGVAATLTGTLSATVAASAVVQSTTDVVFPGGGLAIAGLNLLMTVTEDGVAGDSTTLTFVGGPYANIAALVTAATAALTAAGLNTLVSASNAGDRLAFTTAKTGKDQGISLAITGTANTSLNFSTVSVTSSVGRDEEYGTAATVTGDVISLPLVGLTTPPFEITVADSYGTHIVTTAATDVSADATLGDLRDAIAAAFGNATPTDGKLFDGVIEIGTLTTSGDADVYGTLTLTTTDVGAAVTIAVTAVDLADGFRSCGFHDNDGDTPAEIASTTPVDLTAWAGDRLAITGTFDLDTGAGGHTGGPYANASDLAAALNAVALLTADGGVGDRVVWWVGDDSDDTLYLRTLAGGAATDLELTATEVAYAGNDKVLNDFDAIANNVGSADGQNSDDTGADGLNGTTLSFQLDSNPHVFGVTFISNSLPDAISDINTEVGASTDVADEAGTRQLRLTSTLVGVASSVFVSQSSAHTILGFVDPNHVDTGSGRPLPDFYLDDSGDATFGGQILRTPLTGQPYTLASALADVYLSYEALRLDVTASAATPDTLTLPDTTTIDSAIGPISTRNPLALGAFLAKVAAPTYDVTALGIDEENAAAPFGTIDGWARALELLESKEIYALAALQDDATINGLIKTHVEAFSVPEERGERVALLWQPVEDRAPATSLVSGSDAETNGTDNSLTLDVNPGPALIAAGVDISTTIPVSDEVYLHALITEAGSTRLVRYSLSAVSGSVLTLRTTFATGENDDSFYSTATLDGASGLDNVAWVIYERGAPLVIAGSTITDLSAMAVAGATEGTAYNSRRVVLAYCSSVDVPVDGIDQNVEGFYANASLAGLVAEQLPQIPKTRVALPGIAKVYGTDDTFSENQLDTIADGGRMVLVNRGGAVVPRHARTTAVTSIEVRELSITAQIDWVAKGYREVNADFIGGRVITPGLLDELSAANQGFTELIATRGVVSSADMESILQDSANPDTILITVDVTPAYPLNKIRVTVVV